MKVISSVLTFFLFITSCEKYENAPIVIDDNGVLTSLPWKWRILNSETGRNGGYVSYPVYYGDGVLVGSEDNQGINYFRFLNSENGSVIWSQDYIYEATFFDVNIPYISENFMVIRDGHDIFCLDLITGEYKWKIRDEEWGDQTLTGIDSLYFTIDAIIDPITGYPNISAFVGNINDGNIELFLVPDLGDLPVPDLGRVNMSIGGFCFIKPFHDSFGKIMLLCYYFKQYYLNGSEEQISESYLGLYNYSDKEWVYERIPLGAYNFLEGFTPTILGDRVYHTLSGGVSECRNLYTGEEIWRNDRYFYQLSWRSFIVVDDKMIVMDDWTGNLMAYRLSDGELVWKTESSPTIEYMQELNGVVYFRSAADSKIHAFEAETGRYLWKLISPDEENNYLDGYMGQCTVIPGKDGEKGKVVVSSFSHTYCYEAAR